MRQDFKLLSEKRTIRINCNKCKDGFVEKSLSDIRKILEETYQIRKDKKKDICSEHNQPAEYCLQCKQWICNECKNIFHNNRFKNHNLVEEEPSKLNKCKIHEDKDKVPGYRPDRLV